MSRATVSGLHVGSNLVFCTCSLSIDPTSHLSLPPLISLPNPSLPLPLPPCSVDRSCDFFLRHDKQIFSASRQADFSASRQADFVLRHDKQIFSASRLT